MSVLAPAAETESPEKLVASANGPSRMPDQRRGHGEHRDFLLSRVRSLKPFGIGLLDAAGLALCETIVADLDLPLVTTATTEGWGVRSSNLAGATIQRPIVLPVVDEIPAGGFAGAPLTAGTAVRVEAGAPVPQGVDAVVPLADGEPLGEAVSFTAEATFQQNLQLAGSRIADGDALLAAGDLLTPRALSLLAEVGHDKVLVRPRPRVVVLTAATDLVEPGLPLTRITHSYDASSVLLSAAARDDGGHVFPAGLVAPDAVARVLSEQLVRADIILLLAEATAELEQTLAGLGSVDAADVDALAGRHLFALVGEDQVPVLVLPPQPVAAYLNYLLFARPLLAKLAGAESKDAEPAIAPITDAVAAPDGPRLLLARHNDRGVTPLPSADPGAAELAAANAVVMLPAGAQVPAHGDVTCWFLD